MLVGEVFARMGLDSKQYEKDLDRLENETKKRALTLGNIFKGALSVTIGMTMFEAVKRGFQTVVGESISFNAQMEQARIGFTTMLGSAERAQVFLDDMAKFAAKTPFEFPELLDASKRMLAYGFAAEDVLPTMEAVGNASAAVGLGTEGINRIILALGQMRAKGKLSGEEMRQLTETGIPAWEILAEAMNKTTAEIMDMQQKGLIPADRAIKMLVDGMNKRFPNMMAQMENTWEGVTSTIKDIWQMTIGAVTQNLFQGVVSWLQKVRDFAVGFYDTFQRYGLQRAISESFGPEVAALVSVLGATLRGLASVVSAVTGFITKYGKQIRFVAVVMGAYLVLLKTVTLAKWLATVATTALTNSQLLLAGQSSATTGIIGFLSNVITFYKVQMLTASGTTNAFTGALFRLRAALYAVWTALGPIGWAILGISLAVAGGMSLWNKYSQSVYSGAKVHDELTKVTDQVEGSAGGATGAIEDETDALKKAGKAAGKNLQSFDEVHQLQEDMAGSAEDLAKSMGLDDTEFGVPDAGGFGIPDIGAQLEEMKPTLAGFWEWIKQGAGNLWEGIKEKWNGFKEWVSSWGIWTTLKEKWSGFKEWAGNLWEGIKEKWSGFWEWVKSWDLWDWLGQKWQDLKNLAGTVWAGIADVASTAWNGVVNVTQTIWQEIWNLLHAYWGNTAQLATDIFGAIWGYIKGTWDNIKTAVSDIWGAIWDFLSNQWNAIKELGSSIFGALRDLILGKIDLRTAVSQIWKAIKTFFSDTWTNIKNLGIGIWTAIGNFFKDQWELIKTLASTIWTAIKEFFAGNWEATKEAASNIWNAIKTFFSNTWEAIKTAAANIWTAIRDFLGINWEETKKRASEIWSNIKTIITDKWNELKNAVGPTWNRIKTAIADKWREIKDDAFNWGKNLINSFVEGIKNKINSVKSTLKSVGQSVKNFIGFSSPTKEGPGRFADEWAPNLMNMFAEGLNQNIPKVRSAVDEVAQQLTGMTVQPTVQQSIVPATTTTGDSGLADTVAQAVYRAVIDAIRVVQASSQQSDDRELVLKIDNTVLARMQLPAIIREGQRQGLNLVVRPQGV
jgi:tape measure domain-containing protein